MKNRLHIWSVALLATLVVGASNTVWAQFSGRALVAGRQRVQAALAAALADGRLSITEQYSILQKGKRLLPPDELQGLKLTLLELSTAEQVSFPGTPSEKPTQERVNEQEANQAQEQKAEQAQEEEAEEAQEQDVEPANQPKTEGVEQAKLVATGKQESAEAVSYQEPPEANDEENPFQEEPPPGQLEAPAEGTLLSCEGLAGFGGLEGCGGLGLLGGCSTCEFERWPDLRLSTTVEAFKGPLDLDNRNGNFGLQFAINGGFPLAPRFGIGAQAGTSGVLSDFQGTQFTGSTIRAQSFTTVGLFQRVPLRARRLKWGFAFDWLSDDYYSLLEMSQWRVKLAYELSCDSEVGIWSCIPNDGDLATLDTDPVVFERFKPVAQGYLYYNRCWQTGASTTGWVGIAEEPGEFIFGGDARVPLNCRWAIVGTANYVLPSASGAWGQDEEQWYVSVGIELTPGWGGNHCLAKKFSPLFPLANNGTFAIRRF